LVALLKPGAQGAQVSCRAGVASEDGDLGKPSLADPTTNLLALASRLTLGERKGLVEAVEHRE
jgi:hypothetical protein